MPDGNIPCPKKIKMDDYLTKRTTQERFVWSSKKSALAGTNLPYFLKLLKVSSNDIYHHKAKNTAPTSSPSDFRTAEASCVSQVQSCSYVNVEEKGEKSKWIPPSEKKKAELKNRLECCFCSHPTDEIWSISHILLSKRYWSHTLEHGTFVTKWNVSCQCQALYVINNVFSGVG